MAMPIRRSGPCCARLSRRRPETFRKRWIRKDAPPYGLPFKACCARGLRVRIQGLDAVLRCPRPQTCGRKWRVLDTGMAGGSWRTKGLDQDDRLSAANFTLGKEIGGYWGVAQTPPEETRGSIRSQIEACKQMDLLGHEPALAMLSELTNIDPS